MVSVLAGAVVSCAFLTYRRSDVWQDSETLWRDVLAKYPALPPAHNNLGVAYAGRGMWAAAAVEYERAVERDPGYARAHFNLSVYHYRSASYSLAVRHFDRAVECGYSPGPELCAFMDSLRRELRAGVDG